MFIVILTYKTSIELVDKHVIAHRAFLDEGYKNNYFITSGPQEPRTGGVIISQLKNRALLENIIKKDPFSIAGVADYQIIEFNPNKWNEHFSWFL